MSNIADLIALRGENVDIYHRSSSGTDEYDRPKYTWAKQATEKALIQEVGRASGVGEVIIAAGELSVDDRVGFFSGDSVIQDDDQVVWTGSRYDVKAVDLRRVGGSTLFKVAVLKRMVE